MASSLVTDQVAICCFAWPPSSIHFPSRRFEGRAVPDDDLSNHAHQRVAALRHLCGSVTTVLAMMMQLAFGMRLLGMVSPSDVVTPLIWLVMLQLPFFAKFYRNLGTFDQDKAAILTISSLILTGLCLGWLQTVSGSATLPFGFMVFMWQVPAVIETAHTIMNGKSPFAEATASDTETSGAEWCK